MARPIKATPVLRGKAIIDFQKSLKEDEEKKLEFSCTNLDSSTKKKIVDDGPHW